MSSKKIAIFAAALIGALAFSAVSAQSASSGGKKSSESAQSGQQQPAPTFSELDRNHDGRLMRSEIPHSMHRLRMHFRQYDLNGNGWLSKKEYEAYAHPAKYEQI